ncbi:hypothetical protein ACFV0L_41485 [Streptosporangium canum]|uniref:hypothetical protein n=1 Tax=Streptosporangium canum TaxID=324952 RepID=UPI0036C62DCD
MTITAPAIPVPAAATGESQVLALLRQGKPVPQISDATTWPAAAVRKLAARNGLLVDAAGVAYAPEVDYYSQRVEKIEGADVEELLSMAYNCPDAKVRQARARLQHDVQALREQLSTYEKKKGQVAAAEHAAAEANAEIARLAAQLDQAKAKLREASTVIGRTMSAATPRPARRRYQPGVDYSTAEARQWAKDNGYGDQLPKYGRYVPDEVIDAMRAAQAEAAS